MSLYGPTYNDRKYRRLYRKLERTEGVEYHGCIRQDRLAREFMEAEVLAYPNLYPETSCLTAMEAQAGGAAIVTSAFAGLNEIVPDDAGIKIMGDPESREYRTVFVKSVVELLENKNKREAMSKAGMEKEYGWESLAELWIEEFFSEADGVEATQPGGINSKEYWDEVYRKEIKRRYIRSAPERSAVIKKYISDGDKVLDVGCGTGWQTRDVKRTYPDCEVRGSDISNVAIEYCRKKNKKIFYSRHPWINEDLDRKYFDVIIISHVLEHLERPEDVVDRAREYLRDDGRMVIVLPIDDDPYFEHVKVWGLEDVGEFLKRWDCEFEVILAGRGIKGKEGRNLEEGIFIVNFSGGHEG